MAEVKDKLITLESLKSAFDHLVTLINGKANSSHGNHVPATQTADNAKFLRNDNTWQTVTPANIGAAASSHGTHVSYSSTAPVMDGTASVGSASTVARSDHKHPTDTSRLSTSNVLNNVTTTNSGYALDARQGKALQDQITQLSSNLSVTNSSVSNIKYVKYGNIVQISYSQTLSTTSGSWTTLGTLPSGYRPKIETYITVSMATNAGWIRITTGGIVSYYVHDAVSETLRFSTSFITA